MSEVPKKPRGPHFWALFTAMGLTILIIQTAAPFVFNEPANPVWVGLGGICTLAGLVIRKREKKSE